MQVNLQNLRTDLETYFSNYVFEYPARKQKSPFIVINNSRVTSCYYIDQLLKFPDNALVFQAWPGQWRSDVFHYTVGDLRNWQQGCMCE